ncbi:Type 2A phosphatase-associated protein 42 [Coemansia sp. RSA 1813]|nr:Type 2A phosphatase-associated protein 42 [Coemansia sp. RSA 1646]KAJ1773810.1 Type 2A phosphatase-associated protein 42 [Coemansia sp. RSA 1843]KAJ2093773.1 Type 2A phosphatase-associated protein 42 [Coemansia sp. RSA 986]KAJ2217984.1 Type 2A phosphatase-associated protein 42 [Coemansia sp. RSA 487]KAJ2573173.1 Type 2A phosphatase-associated protein 42 [Coemansia sp. RSA 1813]
MDPKDGKQDSLRVNFERSQRELQALNSSEHGSSSEEYQKQAMSLVGRLRQCDTQVHQLSLFSSNETPDDYSTGELKLILVNAYLGEALQKLHAPENRVSVLEEAQEQYRQFLTNCFMLGIFKPSSEAEKKLISRFSNRSAAQTSSGDSAASDRNPLAAGQGRMEKIARFKQMRAMQQAIADLEAKLSSRSDDDMDEAEREHAIKLIDLKSYQVIDDMSAISDEIVMAKQMEEMKRHASGAVSGDVRVTEQSREEDWRLDSGSYGQIDPRTGQPVRTIFDKSGRPTQPFVITNDRQRIKDGVFRPGWALPTMTVDEYLQQEKERGNIISGGGKEPDMKPEIDDNDYDALDAETAKQREWDDFKDDNPRGSGNRGGNRG